MTKEELKIDVLEPYKNLSDSEVDVKCREKGIHVKFDKQLDWLIDYYPKAIEKELDMVENPELPGDVVYSYATIGRMREKLAAALKEKEYREKGIFVDVKKKITGENIFSREIRGSIYYIDLDGGNDGDTGADVGHAWLTIEQYTSVTARTAGDIAYVRAGTTETVGAANITFDENGNANDLIYLIGCDSVINDPWGDASDVKPILDFNSGAYYFYTYTRNYWWFANLEFNNSISTTATIYMRGGPCFYDNIDVSDNVGGLYVYTNGNSIISNSDFHSNTVYGIYVMGGAAYLKDVNIYGNGYGINASGFNNTVYLKNVIFGAGTENSTYDIYVASAGSIAFGRNVTFNSTNKIDIGTVANSNSVRIEDYGGVKGANILFTSMGTITKDTGVTHSGGANSSAKIEPSSNCTPNFPLTISGDKLSGDFVIWAPASETTVTVYIRAIDAWGTYPTNAQLYIDAEYFAGGVTKRAVSTASTQVLSDASTWVAFTITFTPDTAGWAYVSVHLNYYEASKGVYVDVKPVVT